MAYDYFITAGSTQPGICEAMQCSYIFEFMLIIGLHLEGEVLMNDWLGDEFTTYPIAML